MLDYLARRVRYSLGNGVRYLTRPWRQWRISPEEATTIFACGYGADGWHHLRRTFAEIDDNPEIAPQATTLWRYLKHFQPKSISELAGADGEPLPLFIYPWGSFKRGTPVSIKSPEQSRFCGPSEDSFIIDEFERVRMLYFRMQETGYQPSTFPNSFISGTWLIRTNGQRRFVVLQGNHRLAVLSHLAYTDIAVRAMPGCLVMIREKDIKNWSLVRQGRCSEQQARAIFHLFFEESGFQVARRLAEVSIR